MRTIAIPLTFARLDLNNKKCCLQLSGCNSWTQARAWMIAKSMDIGQQQNASNSMSSFILKLSENFDGTEGIDGVFTCSLHLHCT
jgi:hypothetical protein